ncbi:hypothetical protein [Altererythrobacter sp. TH136]|nr:hypothetical protein [Altererythrobacter sp. TH136]
MLRLAVAQLEKVVKFSIEFRQQVIQVIAVPTPPGLPFVLVAHV